MATPGAPCDFSGTSPSWAPPSTGHNVFKDPDITNLHTHGLHVSGETPADDPLRVINGGECGDYVRLSNLRILTPSRE